MRKAARRPYTREDESLDQYLQEIGEVELLTAQEEWELAGRIKGGDHEALEKLVTANLRFVVSIAKRYQYQGLSLPDLISEGNLGLIEAAKRFDGTKGFRFISYAIWWVKQTILRALAEQSRIVRLPMNMVGVLQQMEKISRELEQELGRGPSTLEIADELGMGADEVMDILRTSRRAFSLDAPSKDGEYHRHLDMLEDALHPPPDESVMDSSLRLQIEKALSDLTEREAEVIRLRFGIHQEETWTLEQIGQRYGLTRERVRQIEGKAIARLRHGSRSGALQVYCA